MGQGVLLGQSCGGAGSVLQAGHRGGEWAAMRIVLAHKYFFRGGGTATYLFGLREQLHRMGHETIPFTVDFERTAVDEYSEFYVSPPDSSANDHLKDMTMTPWLALKLLARSTWSVEAYYKARALVEATRPDIAYVHNLYTYMSPSPIKAFKDAGVPVVMRVSDYNMLCPGLKLLRDGRPCYDCLGGNPASALAHRCHKDSLPATAGRVLTNLVQSAIDVYTGVDLFLTPSRFLAGLLAEAGYGADLIHHLPSFYEANGQVIEDDPSAPYILYFGRIAPEKGLGDLIRAHSMLDSPPRLVIAGADTLDHARQLKDLVLELDCERVEFVGFKEPDALSKLIAGSMFVVVPSVWPDNCPMSVLEAFAHGKPVIGSDIGGLPEQITADCGRLTRPGDPDELARQMTELIDDAALRRRLGANARERVAQIYAPDAHCEELLQHFERLIG
ncbi:MAG: glycosyltransferase [Armatimonadia bacterium]|nr:glycosyltransferase [Armatimonadia bacterium]